MFFGVPNVGCSHTRTSTTNKIGDVQSRERLLLEQLAPCVELVHREQRAGSHVHSQRSDVVELARLAALLARCTTTEALQTGL